MANPRDPQQLGVQRVRRRHRILARLLATSLDRQLAAGRAPESTLLLATRAQQLAADRLRRQLARHFDHLLKRVDGAVAVRSPRVLACRESIKDAEQDLREMLAKLVSPLPTSARGVAMARMLLTDGTGPLFNRRCTTSLRNAIHDTTAQLDAASGADDVALLRTGPGQNVVTRWRI